LQLRKTFLQGSILSLLLVLSLVTLVPAQATSSQKIFERAEAALKSGDCSAAESGYAKRGLSSESQRCGSREGQEIWWNATTLARERSFSIKCLRSVPTLSIS